MKTKLAKINSQIEANAAAMEAIISTSENGVLSAEQTEQFDKLKAETETLLKSRDSVQAVINAKNEAAKGKVIKVEEPVISDPQATQSVGFSIPANVRRGGSLKAFKGDEKTAYSFGQFIRAANGVTSAREWCNNNGVMLAVSNEGTNTQGGYLVPQQFDNAIIDLRNQYGVFRRNAGVKAMTSDTMYIPRRAGGLTTYWVGESSAITESTKTWDQVQLVAKKLGCLTRMSSELSEDAIISVADDLANEIAYAFAYAEDLAGFIGDGTSTYGGITGVSTALKAAAGTPTTTSAGGVIVGNDKDLADLTLGNFNAVVGKCPSYARMGAKWFCSPFVFDAVMARLAYAAGGNTVGNILGGSGMSFLGYPVELVEVMPSTDATSQIVALFGSLDKAAKLGDRRQTTLAFSDSAVVGGESVFEKDQIAVRGTERIDIVVHDVGGTSAAGAIVGLQTLNA